MNRLTKGPCASVVLSVLLGFSALPALAQEPAKLDPAVAGANAQRAKLISLVPASTGDYTFIANRLRLAWEGMTDLRIQRDYFASGIDAMDTGGPDWCVYYYWYWPMEKVQAGKYYIGLWLQTNDPSPTRRTEYSPRKLLTTIYINGFPCRFSTTSDPVQVKPDLWIAELQTPVAVELREGDEISLCGADSCSKILRLALYRKEPARGHGVTGRSWGVGTGTPQQAHLQLFAKIVGVGKGDGNGECVEGQPHEARITVANPTAMAAKVDVDWTLADFFGKPLAKKVEPVTVGAHKSVTITYKFTVAGADRGYQLDVRTRPSAGARQPQRPLEMFDLSDYARLAFLPVSPGLWESWAHSRLAVRAIDSGDRMLLPLDGGGWETAVLTTRRVPQEVPANLDFKPTVIPYGREGSRTLDDFGQWCRRSFRLPPGMAKDAAARRFVIDIGQVNIEGTVFLNGKKFGTKCEGVNLPLITDVTDAIKTDGDNVLVVCLRDCIARIPQDRLDTYKRTDDVDDSADLVNNSWNLALAFVSLRTTPPVRVNQVLPIAKIPPADQPSTGGKLRVRARLENTTAQAQKFDLAIAVEQLGKPVKATFPPTSVELAAGERREICVEGQVQGIAPYTHVNPVMAKLTVSLSAGGKEIDSLDQRFAWRELRVEGLQFRLNGLPKRLLGAFSHFPASLFERQDGIEVSRDYWIGDKLWDINYFDEVGKSTYLVAEGPGPTTWGRLNNPHRWESNRRIAVEMAWQYGWHPSVIGYDLSNESFEYAPYISGAEGQSKDAELEYEVAQTLRTKIDPDLWIFGDGDSDFGGKLNFCSFHYLSHGINANRTSSPVGFTDPVKGGFHYTPDCFYLNGAAGEPKVGTVVNLIPPWTYGTCACAETESFWFFDRTNAIWSCSYLGDRAAVSSNWQFQTGRGMNWTKVSLDAYRDMDMAIITGVYWWSSMALGMQSVAFVMPQMEVRYFSGATLDKRVTIWDDQGVGGDVRLGWQLLDDKGGKVSGGEIRKTSTTRLLVRDRIRFQVPDVPHPTKYSLVMELTKDGRLWGREDRVVDVWPRPRQAVPLSAAPALYDPQNLIAPVLSRLGATVKPISMIDPKSLTGFKSLVIGPMAIDESSGAAAQAIRDFASAGGRVIVMEQANSLAVPADTYVEQRGRFSICFARTKDHPVMQGLTDADFQMWNPNHLLTTRALRRPARGNFTALVEGGFDGSLCWTPLLEVYVGKGSVLATQLDLVGKFDTEPMCAELLHRMLGYLDQPVYRSPQGSLVVVNASKEVQARLEEIRAEVSTKPARGAAWLLDLNSPIQRFDVESYKRHLQEGGTLIVHRARAEHAAWLSELIGKPVTITVQPYQSWEDRQMLDQDSPLTAGLNNVDFYWRSHIICEAPEGTEQVSNGVQKHRFGTEYVVRVEGVRDLLFPGGLLDVPVGAGRVIVDQLNWEMSDEDIVGGSPQRVISMLLTNLGVVQRPPLPRPTLPSDVAYETLDISAQANTSTTDHKAGGNEWCAWGPTGDIRDLPTGKVTLNGVPFDIPQGKFNAIVLRTNWIDYLKKFPDTVTVPVGKSGVLGLHLLHTGGWSGGRASFGRREICYADGTKEFIDMNCTNMGDWNYGRDQFPDEESTTTTVAWRGSCGQYPVTRVYRTLWVNPHPEKRIDNIIITNAGLVPDQWRFTPHLAVTLVTKGTGASRPAGDAVKAKAIIAEATELLRQEKPQQALVRLDAAIKADPANSGAWQLIADIRIKTDDVAAFTALCEKWMSIDPRNPQPYNMLASYNEGKGRLNEALRLYKKSLQVEWNQPPVGESVRRLEKKLQK